MIATVPGWLLLALAIAGIGYCLVALVAVERFARQPLPPAVAPEPVTLLKPLHGAEPRLPDNLQSSLDQDWPAAIQLVAGVQRTDDSAIESVRALRRGPRRQVDLVRDATVHGANAKVGNLVSMMARAEHDLLILSDSDMAMPSDHVAQVAAALAQSGVGVVTCLYRGRGDAGLWSVVAAAGLSWGFLPSVLVSRLFGDRRACMGSTIALRRETLAAIGGFEAFADTLADDHAIGAAVRARGMTIAVPRLILAHACGERSLAAVVRHELRWAATVRDVVSGGEYLGLACTNPLPLALLASPLVPHAAVVTMLAALAARLLLAWRLDRLAGARTAPYWLLPLRDLLSFGIFAASLGVRSVDWRGARLHMVDNGRIERRSEPIP